MVYQFEGRTEKEAIENAARELGLTQDKFDVEIIETQKGGLFKKPVTRIEVHTTVAGGSVAETAEPRPSNAEKGRKAAGGGGARDDGSGTPAKKRLMDAVLAPENDFEKSLCGFVDGVLEKMGYAAKTSVQFREPNKVGLRVVSEQSALIIGKKGKNLDALQVVANIYAIKIGKSSMRVVVDSENYRLRREENIVRLAYNVADKVRGSRGSLLLEPMNPFERRIVHSALSGIGDITTHSEGEGLYKQVRVSFRGSRRKN